jgi:hypothetical protein
MAIETTERVQIIHVFSSRTCARIIQDAELAEGWQLANIVDGNDGKLKLNVEIRNAHVFDESMAPDRFASWRKILEARLERFVGTAAGTALRPLTPQDHPIWSRRQVRRPSRHRGSRLGDRPRMAASFSRLFLERRLRRGIDVVS